MFEADRAPDFDSEHKIMTITFGPWEKHSILYFRKGAPNVNSNIMYVMQSDFEKYWYMTPSLGLEIVLERIDTTYGRHEKFKMFHSAILAMQYADKYLTHLGVILLSERHMNLL